MKCVLRWPATTVAPFESTGPRFGPRLIRIPPSSELIAWPGEFQAFRDAWRRFPTGEGWHRHPITGVARSPDRQWWRRNLLDPEFGDVKDLWEPARFGWVYDLVRGYLLTRDPRYRAAFVERFVDWWAANPPMTGPHWSCGQETAIRAIAMLYAEANLDLGDDGRTVIDALGASGERIRDAIGYALSQRNNHGLSEAVGLLAIGDQRCASS